jgi:hypothetical protein
MTASINKKQFVDRTKDLIAGSEQLMTGTTPLSLVGSMFTPAEVRAKLQAIVNLRADVEAAQGLVKARLAAEAAAMPASTAFVSALTAHVKVAHPAPDALAAFGIHPKARTPLTLEAQAAAAAKRAATRAARHTMGSRQKAAIKGDVTGVIVTPVRGG